MIQKTTALLAASLLVLAGCGSSVSAEGDGDEDTTSDMTDMGTDSGPDATPDATPDGTPDGPGPDATPDGTPDGPIPDGTPDGPIPDGPGPDATPDGPAPTGAVGDPCRDPSMCTDVPATGRDCLTDIGGMLSFPGGYCSANCTSDSDCGTGGECVDLFGYMAYCLKTCTSPGECRTTEGYTCTTIPGTTGGDTYCLPPLGGPDGGPIDP
jgi:hypothetical protein